MPSYGTVTLAQVRDQAQQRADMVNSSFVSTSEWNGYISNSYKELYDLLIAAYGNDYEVAVPVLFNTDGTSQLYPLPDGTITFTNALTGQTFTAPPFYKLLGVDLALQPGNPGSFVTINRFTFAERNKYAVPNFQSFYGVTNLRYRLQGNNIWFTPIPAGSQTIQLWYIPEPATLSNDSDSFDGIAGWEEYVIIDAAIKAMGKEESDTSLLERQKASMTKRLQDMAENRDAANPARVSDVQSNEYSFPDGNGSGWY